MNIETIFRSDIDIKNKTLCYTRKHTVSNDNGFKSAEQTLGNNLWTSCSFTLFLYFTYLAHIKINFKKENGQMKSINRGLGDSAGRAT